MFLETIKVANGEFLNLDFHQWRINWTLKELNINNNINLINYISQEFNLDKNKIYRCRILYQKDILEIQFIEYFEKNIKNIVLLNGENLNYKYKFSNRSQIELLKQNIYNSAIDEVLFYKNGFITDFSIGNIAIKNKNIWITPKEPILRGTTRERFLRKNELVETDILKSDFINLVKNGSEIAILNSLVGFKILPDLKIIF